MTVRLALADLRDSWLAWLGVCTSFIAANFALVLCIWIIWSANGALERGEINADDHDFFTAMPIWNLTFGTLVSLAVISTSTGLVIAARRGAIARLLLAGAQPRQVVGMLMTQLGIVSLVCSVVGIALAGLLAVPAMELAIDEQPVTRPDLAASAWPGLLGAAACALVAMLGGLRQARRASRIPPIEALRASQAAAPRRRSVLGHVLRVLAFAAVVAMIVVMIRFAADLVEEGGDDAASAMAQAAFGALILTGCALALVADYIVAPLTRAWTRIIPVPGASWHLARHGVTARGERLTKTVIPTMFSVGLLFGLMAYADTLVASLTASYGGSDVSGVSVAAIFTMFGLPLIIATAGSVGSLVMMSKQRDAELALDGVIGATPTQQATIPLLEAVFVTITATIAGLVMTGVCLAILYTGLEGFLPERALSIPWGTLAGVVVACFAVIAAAILLPTLPSLRQPAPKVIARLVAD